jgi:4-amino-4-deoxychorismate lyase
MCRLLESIRIENGKPCLLDYHQARMDRSVWDLWKVKAISLSEIFSEQNLPVDGLYKCRIVYDQVLRKIEFVPYKMKSIKTLKLVEGQGLDYALKFEDRTAINVLFQLKENCDDILIVQNGLITDSSFCNVAFSDGGNWFTPETPLLEGTMRQYLIDRGILKERKITIAEIKSFQKLRLINAMMPWGQGPELDVQAIF